MEVTDENDVYSCGICKKEFEDFVTFLQHKSTFGVFKCKLCNLSYHDRDDIQQHITESHNNQKVDVVFTIPTKANIVSTRSEQPENETPKPGGSVSVYTCRLCNRFTVVERTMLQHLQNVHKIHVSPGSVELAALMLCAKPLDSSSISRLTGNPVVVKTVTAPVASTKLSRTTSTQTRLSIVDISTLAQMESVDEQNISWIELADETVIATENSVKIGGADDSSQPVKMTSILKPVADGSKPECDVIDVKLSDVEQVVCVDGGHDYICNINVDGKRDVQLAEDGGGGRDVPKIDEVSAIMELQEDLEEETHLLLMPSPKKYAGRKSTSGGGPSQSVISSSQPAKRNLEQIKRPALKSISRVVIPSPLKADDSEDYDEEDDDDEDEEEEPEEFDENPQPGRDGMYHCRQCNRAFARERQFKAHMNVHVMYGEHYLESPGGGGRHESKSTYSNRKRVRYDMK